MTARCSMRRKRSIWLEGGNSNATICLTAVWTRGTLTAPRCPSGAFLPGGLFAHARTPAARHAGRRRHCSSHSAQWRLPRPHQRLVAHFSIRSRDPGDLLDRVVGNHSLQALDVQPDSIAEHAVPRDLPPQREVLRSAGCLPIAERQPAGRNFSRRLRRAESATSAGRRRCKYCQPPAPAGAADAEIAGRRSIAR